MHKRYDMSDKNFRHVGFECPLELFEDIQVHRDLVYNDDLIRPSIKVVTIEALKKYLNEYEYKEDE